MRREIQTYRVPQSHLLFLPQTHSPNKSLSIVPLYLGGIRLRDRTLRSALCLHAVVAATESCTNIRRPTQCKFGPWLLRITASARPLHRRRRPPPQTAQPTNKPPANRRRPLSLPATAIAVCIFYKTAKHRPISADMPGIQRVKTFYIGCLPYNTHQSRVRTMGMKKT